MPGSCQASLDSHPAVFSEGSLAPNGQKNPPKHLLNQMCAFLVHHFSIQNVKHPPSLCCHGDASLVRDFQCSTPALVGDL